MQNRCFRPISSLAAPRSVFLVQWVITLALLAGLITLADQALAHGISEGHQSEMLHAGFWGYARLGAIHMLTGYDHILFLIGVMFYLTRFSDIIRFVTAFTIGHSVTLLLATLYEINANYNLIDAVIALTVCYKAFENLGGFERLLGMKAPDLTLMVFVFGLVHGFGLSTRLQQLPLGHHGLIGKIVGFNVGVELGQIAALIPILLILLILRKTPWFNAMSRLANLGLLALGALLCLMQLHQYEHTHIHTDEPAHQHRQVDTK